MIYKNFIFVLLVAINFATCKSNHTSNKTENSQGYDQSMEDVNTILIRKDLDKMLGFARNHDWEIEEDSTGFLYEIYEKGFGQKAETGKLATINYTVRLLDGTLCYTSDSLGARTFMISHGGVETGLEYGILKMRVGDKARFLFPPYLAHGLIGDEDKIPARSIIYYDVELLGIN